METPPKIVVDTPLTVNRSWEKIRIDTELLLRISRRIHTSRNAPHNAEPTGSRIAQEKAPTSGREISAMPESR
jgi:hypothetical protein